MKKYFYLPILFLFLFTCSCKKYSETNLEGALNAEKQIDKKEGPNALTEEEVMEDFEDALSAASVATFTDLTSSSYQLTSVYTNLSTASVALLQEADMLDSIKFHLNISNNSDPKLILAARLISEMVMFPPPPLNVSSSMPGWVDCLVEAGIGVSIETLRQIAAGGTLWHVGQAIKHMGYKWFAKTVGKTLTKVLTGFGAALIVADFSWCMVREYGDAEILEPGFEPSTNNIPVSFFNANKNYYDYYKAGFLSYMAIAYPLEVDNEFWYYYTYEYDGDPTFEGSYFVQEYFQSLISTPPPPSNN
jgi:hypothetical protein